MHGIATLQELVLDNIFDDSGMLRANVCAM